MKHTQTMHAIGIDLGDKSHETCTLNHEGAIIERITVLNNREALIAFSKANRGPTKSSYGQKESVQFFMFFGTLSVLLDRG